MGPGATTRCMFSWPGGQKEYRRIGNRCAGRVKRSRSVCGALAHHDPGADDSGTARAAMIMKADARAFCASTQRIPPALAQTKRGAASFCETPFAPPGQNALRYADLENSVIRMIFMSRRNDQFSM